MKNIVIGGDYKGFLVAEFNGLYLAPPGMDGLKKENKIFLNAETVEAITEKSKNSDSGVGKRIVQQTLFGIGTTASKNTTHLVGVEFKDGKKSLLKLDDNKSEKLLAACYK